MTVSKQELRTVDQGRRPDDSPIRLAKVRQARERIRTGFYDQPKVIDSTVARVKEEVESGV